MSEASNANNKLGRMESTDSNYLHHVEPSICAPNPKDLKNIVEQMHEYRIIFGHELRIARRMGIIPTIPVARLGFNDGIVYPCGQLQALPDGLFLPRPKPLRELFPKREKCML